MSDGSTEAAAITAGLELVKMGSSNQRLRAAGDNVAYVGEVLTGLLKTALMPLAVVNARAEVYFNSKFPAELAAKMKDVPTKYIASPKPSVAGPALQGLGYSHEEDSLRDLYVSLLATAMDGRVASTAHPGFAEIIGALSADEVSLLNSVLTREILPCAEVRIKTEGVEGWNVVHRHLIDAKSDMGSGIPIVNTMNSAYIDNWVRLGLVEVSYMSYLTVEGAYDWVEPRPEYIANVGALTEGQNLTYERGVIRPSAFGIAFASAVGIR
ncbi:MAG TPA: DUF4393 domain-containing protein [Galbitalea sp.]